MDIARAAQLISRASRLVVLTGAGVSKESGIPTFREAQEGLWAQYDAMAMASEEGFRRNPRLVWEWYEYRFGMIKSVRPNPGHVAIAQLESLIHKVTVVTQNIDGLHRHAGSTSVLELHGSIQRYKCLSGRHTGFSLDDIVEQAEKPPRCPKCGDLMRPDVVWFGEYLHADVMRKAYDACQRCDAMLVVGTSGVVQPAASLPYVAARTGAVVVDVNPEHDEISEMADVFLQGKGGAVLPELLSAMQSER
ncbi:MAG: SIR2 family NAD-dependent protein deacylase [Nitrososphaerales archaeon]